jgi:hypothetical protein
VASFRLRLVYSGTEPKYPLNGRLSEIWFWSERRKTEVVLFVSGFALQYMLANFLMVPADRNKLQRKESRNIGSVWETYISNGTAAVRSWE